MTEYWTGKTDCISYSDNQRPKQCQNEMHKHALQLFISQCCFFLRLMYPRGATTFQKHLRVYMLIVVPTVVKFTFLSAALLRWRVTFFIHIILSLKRTFSDCRTKLPHYQSFWSKLLLFECDTHKLHSNFQKLFQEVHCHFNYGLKY